MLAVFKNRNFTLLWLAGLISIIGNWVLLAALPFYVFELTGSAMATAGVFMAFMAPGIFLGSIAGVFVDRWDYLRTMFMVNLLQLVVVLLLVFVQAAGSSWIIFAVLFVQSSIAQFFGPAENALLPKLVEEEQLVAANSLNSMNDNLARLIGPAIGGLTLAVYGFSSVVLIDAISFGLAAGLIFVVMVSYTRPEIKVDAIDPELQEKTTTLGGKVKEIWGEWQEGFAVVRGKSILSATFVVIGCALFADAIISAILVIFLQEELGMGSAEFGYIMTARGVGGLLGGLLAGQFGGLIKPRHMLSFSLFALSIVILIAVNFTTLPSLLVAMILGGIPAVAMFIAVQTIFQKNAPEAFLGRVFGLFQTVLMLLMFLGSGVAGLLGEIVSAFWLLTAGALIYIVAGLLGLWLMGGQDVLQEKSALSA